MQRKQGRPSTAQSSRNDSSQSNKHMIEYVRRGEIPSHQDTVAGDGQSSQETKERKNTGPVLGTTWQTRCKGKCLPCTVEKPRYVIRVNKLEKYRSYMRDHSLICKFVGVWLSERDLTKWIEQKWQPQGHIDLKLGAKGFFRVIFFNLQDREKVFENVLYFYYNAGLFMRFWEDRYNPNKEAFLAAPIWVRLFGLPIDFWDSKILEGIGNSIGSFVKIAKTTKKGRYTSYARICVYMNLANPILDTTELEYHEEVW